MSGCDAEDDMVVIEPEPLSNASNPSMQIMAIETPRRLSIAHRMKESLLSQEEDCALPQISSSPLSEVCGNTNFGSFRNGFCGFDEYDGMLNVSVGPIKIDDSEDEDIESDSEDEDEDDGDGLSLRVRSGNLSNRRIQN